MQILHLAFISFKEGLRYRILYGIVLFAAMFMATAILISGFFLRDISKILADLCLSAITVGGLLVPFFLAISLLAKDIERRTIFSILSRSISRAEYILGKFLGVLLLTFTIMAILALTGATTIWIGKWLYTDFFFTSFSWLSFFLAIGSSFLAIMVLNSLVIFWSSLTTSSFLATLLTLCTYVIGQSIEDVFRFASTTHTSVSFSHLFQKILFLILYVFPNLAAFDIKQQAAHGLHIPIDYMLYLLLYGISYSSVALALSISVFRKRELL